jgi:valyl-tRNA synthetase
MLGDTGIAVHPDDDRYRHLIGKRVRHPFFPERSVPIVADEAVEKEFGTGAVKVTPAHDATDFEIGERQGLEKINILDEQASTNEAAGPFAGLDRYEARKKVLESLKELGLVEKEERPYVHSVGHCYRCGTEIEPWLSEQWFVRMKPLAGPAIDAVKDGRIRMEPKRFVKSYIDWMENIRDWCISRQLWWGHRIPVWYCDECNETWAAMEDPRFCRNCASENIRQDTDVLDTWFSSQLWPFSTLGWPDQTEDLEYFYPTSLMAPGYEILYLWVARMITSGLYFMKDVPFREVLIHGIVRDFEGKKMSKSLGNVVDPLDMIDRYGADALRFGLTSGAVPGNDLNISEDRIEGARNFANKLWNASRFVLLSCGDVRPELPEASRLRIEDRWILARLERTIMDVESALAGLNWAEASRTIHRFTWSEYCDWYIELAKLRLDSPDGEAARGVLIHVLDRILRLLHPVMPFVTEEIWSHLRPAGGSIMVAPWPGREGREDLEAEASLGRFQDLVSSLRRLRADHGIDPGIKMNVTVAAGDYRADIEDLRSPLITLARLEDVEFTDALGAEGQQARAITPAGIESSVALGDVIDLDVETARLRKKLEEVDADIARAERKLSNSDFTSKAPPAVVEKEQRKLQEANANRAKLDAQLRSLTER